MSLDQAENRLNELKKERGSIVFMIAVPVDDQGEEYAVCFLRKPDRLALKRALPLITEGKEIEAAEVLMNICWIEGNELIKSDDDLFFPAQQKMAEMMSWRTAILQKK